MTYITTLPNGKSQLNKKQAFCDLLNNNLPRSDRSFNDLIKHFDESIKSLNSDISDGSLKNAHGDWYEWLLAITMWNFHIENPNSSLALLLPNIIRFDVAKLYKEDLYSLILDLREKVVNSTSVELITSNPDFVLIDTANIDLPSISTEPINSISPEIISQLEAAYTNLIHQCDFDNIIGYISVKASLRPDRRLQMAHEGSLMKALYTHLQTRKWIISPPGLKYYAFSTKVGSADRKALKTIATHSITTVHSEPQAAVDEVYEVDSIEKAIEVSTEILL